MKIWKLAFIAIVFFISGCKSNESTIIQTPSFRSEKVITTSTIYEQIFSLVQFDSICQSEKISNKINSDDWRSIYIILEDKNVHNQFKYIETISKTKEIIFRLEIINSDSIWLSKKIKETIHQ